MMVTMVMVKSGEDGNDGNSDDVTIVIVISVTTVTMVIVVILLVMVMVTVVMVTTVRGNDDIENGITNTCWKLAYNKPGIQDVFMYSVHKTSVSTLQLYI